MMAKPIGRLMIRKVTELRMVARHSVSVHVDHWGFGFR